MTDRPYNAGNRKDVRGAEKSQIMFSTITREVIAGVMSLPNGRHWMYELLAAAQAFADPFTPDPHTHAYLTGRKSLGVKLFNDIMLYAPQQFHRMLEEANERAIVLDRVRNNDNRDRTDSDDGADNVWPDGAGSDSRPDPN